MIKTKAAILSTLHKPLLLEEILIDDELKSGQVLIQMESASICGSQIGEIDGIKGVDKHLPHLLGHEGIATVLRVATDVSKVKEGDKVATHWMKSSGIDAMSGKYNSPSLGKINSGPIAIFSEKSIISENRITKISSESIAPIFSTLGCGLLTSYGVITHDLKVDKSRKKLLILGFGGIGQLIYLVGNLITNCEFTIFDKNKNSLRIASKLGIENIYEDITKIPSGEFDYAVDTTGNPKIIEHGYESLQKTGHLCLVGVTPKSQKISLDPMPLHYGKILTGSFGGSAVPNIDIPELEKLVNDNLQYFANFELKTFDFSEINLAIIELRNSPKFSKALISFLGT